MLSAGTFHDTFLVLNEWVLHDQSLGNSSYHFHINRTSAAANIVSALHSWCLLSHQAYSYPLLESIKDQAPEWFVTVPYISQEMNDHNQR
jgi:hypothetical protein